MAGGDVVDLQRPAGEPAGVVEDGRADDLHHASRPLACATRCGPEAVGSPRRPATGSPTRSAEGCPSSSERAALTAIHRPAASANPSPTGESSNARSSSRRLPRSEAMRCLLTSAIAASVATISSQRPWCGAPSGSDCCTAGHAPPVSATCRPAHGRGTMMKAYGVAHT
jgi:hypothetical protein